MTSSGGICRRRVSLLEVHPLDALAAVIIFASTLYFVPHAAFAIGAAFIVLRHGVKFQQRDLLLGLFVVGALVNLLFHSGETSLSESVSSMGVPLVLLTVMAARVAPPQFMLLMVLLICLEVPVGLFEFTTGQVALNANQAALTDQDLMSATGFLYDRRVMGLSSNSSVFAEKLFLAVLLLYGLNVGKRTKLVLMLVLFAGLYITFNRTAIISTLLFFVAVFFLWAVKSPRRTPLALALAGAGIVALIAYLQPVIEQFTRGTGFATYAEVSRIIYLRAAFDFLLDNPLLGNGSVSWGVYDPLYGTLQHAHNSTMMLLVEHGVLLGGVLIAFVALGLRRERMVFVGVMVAFSLTQYFFFWNMSLADLVLHHFTRFGKETDVLKTSGRARMPWEVSRSGKDAGVLNRSGRTRMPWEIRGAAGDRLERP